MKAVVYRCYGSPDVLQVEAIAKPEITDNELLVRVHAVSINPAAIHFMTGKPYIVRLLTGFGAPKYQRLGNDFAGIVESVGRNVKRFKLVMVGGSKYNRWIGPLDRNLDAIVLALFVEQELVSFVSNVNRADLSAIADLALAGKVTPVIDRRYP